MPSALQVTTNQNTGILTPMKDVVTGTLAEALAGGVNIPGPTQVIAPLFTPFQWGFLNSSQQQQAVDAFRATFAAFISTMNFDQVGLGTAGSPLVIGYNKSAGGTGTLTFVGGLLVAST
jgi:hypothetical protein